MTDPATLRAAVRGDEQAFASLLNEQYDRIYRFAWRWCGHQADAEDITQLACIKLARHIGQFREEAAFTTWLYTLVLNTARDWQKSQARHRGEEAVVEEAGFSDTGSRRILLLEVLERIAAMGEGFRETALLVLAEGFSHREAGEMLGVQESTISWRLHEMRRQLSVTFAEDRPKGNDRRKHDG